LEERLFQSQLSLVCFYYPAEKATAEKKSFRVKTDYFQRELLTAVRDLTNNPRAFHIVADYHSGFLLYWQFGHTENGLVAPRFGVGWPDFNAIAGRNLQCRA
jgi:hypothetical protein